MAITVERLRSFTTKRVRIMTDGRHYEGTIVQDRLGDDAVMFLFDTGEAEPIVVGLEATSDVTEVESPRPGERPR